MSGMTGTLSVSLRIAAQPACEGTTEEIPGPMSGYEMSGIKSLCDFIRIDKHGPNL